MRTSREGPFWVKGMITQKPRGRNVVDCSRNSSKKVSVAKAE